MQVNRRVFSWKIFKFPPGALLYTPQGPQGWKVWAFCAELQREEHIAGALSKQILLMGFSPSRCRFFSVGST